MSSQPFSLLSEEVGGQNRGEAGVGSQRASGRGVTNARLLLSHMRQLTHPGHQAGWGTCGDAPVTPTRQLSPPAGQGHILRGRHPSKEAHCDFGGG